MRVAVALGIAAYAGAGCVIITGSTDGYTVPEAGSCVADATADVSADVACHPQ